MSHFKQNLGVKFAEDSVKSATNDAILIRLIGFEVAGNLQMLTSWKCFFLWYIVETTLDNS